MESKQERRKMLADKAEEGGSGHFVEGVTEIKLESDPVSVLLQRGAHGASEDGRAIEDVDTYLKRVEVVV